MTEPKDLTQQLTESLEREKILQERVEDLTDFLENASIPLHWVNASGVIIWANQVELDLLGYTKDEYLGKHISKIHADKSIIEDILDRLVRKETLQNFKAVLKTKDGRLIPVLINSNVRWKDGMFTHTRCFTRDISDLKTAEKEKIDLIEELQRKNLALKSEIAVLKNELAVREVANL
jgi:two-component system sensor histidine kinase VicK